jgi:hypothetical protein
MSRLLICSFVITIIISSIDYSYKLTFLKEAEQITTKLVYNEDRNIRLIELV